MPITSNSQSIANRKIVIAKNGKNTVRRLEAAQALRHRLHVAVTRVNEVAGQHHQIRLLGMGQRNGLFEVGARYVPAGMKIG